MSTLRKLFAVIAAMAIALLLTPGNAFANTDSNNDGEADCLEVSITLSATPNPVTGGQNVTVNAHATANDAPDPAGTLVIHAFGKTYQDPDNDNTVVIKTPKVTKKTVFPVTAEFTPSDRCNTNSAAGTTSGSDVTSANFVISSDDDHVTPASYLKPVNATTQVTVLPAGSGANGNNNGALPNTGGTNLWYLVVGAALLAVGVAIVGAVNSRRKKFI